LQALLTQLYQIVGRLNGFGLLLLGVLDSSLLFLPFGNDLLLVAMVARNPSYWPYFAGMATAGSVLGCLITDAITRKGGEVGLERRFPKRRLDYVRRKMKKSAGWALGLAALMPPPFPFTPFVAAASVLQYPRKRLLASVAMGRFSRFSLEALMAVLLGERILRWGQSPALHYAVMSVLIVSLIGSGFSLYTWAKHSKRRTS
jgi:membrane protein YqaA with SNARE-associated domain